MAKSSTTTQKLDFVLFDALVQADNKNYNWFSELEPERQRKFSAYMMLQWMSSTKNNAGRMVRRANYYANPHMLDTVFNAGEHSLLQWQMLCAAGLGSRQFHQWVPELKKAIREIDPEANITERDFQEYYLKIYPSANTRDIKQLSEASLELFVRKQRLRKIYPDMKTADIEVLASLITDQELDERDQQSGQ